MKKDLKYYIETWGCQMNEEDSEKLSGGLKPLGYKRTTSKEDADIIIFNTCCVRENAEQKVEGNVGALKKLKKERPEVVIAITGCMMQQEGMAENIISKFPFVDIIIGTHNAYKFTEYLTKALGGERPIVEVWDKEADIIEGAVIDRASTIKGFVTIMYGCNNFCTYCIVPHVRGRERSRKPEEIIKEIEDMVAAGYKEVTLLGQNVNSYGKGLEPAIDFAQLLRRINEIQGIERVRFMTSHPKDLSDDVITTDIIVGFPGETEEDFADTLSLIKEVEYDSAFTFLYSKRKGTPADLMLDQVSESVKKERFNRLVEAVNEICAKKNKEYDGKTVEVLVEGISKSDEAKLTGRTRTGKLVNFNGDKASIGNLVNVKITKAQSFSLIGEQV